LKIDLHWSLEIIFPNLFARQYHIAGGEDMGKWADEFRDKFKKDNDNARVDKDRASQKYKLINEKQGQMWKSLRETAQKAIAEINSDESILHFDDGDLHKDNEFGIVYSRGGGEQTRRASAHFRPSSQAMKVEFSNPTKSHILAQEYTIRANDNGDVEFVVASQPKSVDAIVAEMLKNLL
jgi:hypothetical protein